LRAAAGESPDEGFNGARCQIKYLLQIIVIYPKALTCPGPR
jgi:hypothetical protein